MHEMNHEPIAMNHGNCCYMYTCMQIQNVRNNIYLLIIIKVNYSTPHIFTAGFTYKNDLARYTVLLGKLQYSNRVSCLLFIIKVQLSIRPNLRLHAGLTRARARVCPGVATPLDCNDIH